MFRRRCKRSRAFQIASYLAASLGVVFFARELALEIPALVRYLKISRM